MRNLVCASLALSNTIRDDVHSRTCHTRRSLQVDSPDKQIGLQSLLQSSQLKLLFEEKLSFCFLLSVIRMQDLTQIHFVYTFGLPDVCSTPVPRSLC